MEIIFTGYMGKYLKKKYFKNGMLNILSLKKNLILNILLEMFQMQNHYKTKICNRSSIHLVKCQYCLYISFIGFTLVKCFLEI